MVARTARQQLVAASRTGQQALDRAVWAPGPARVAVVGASKNAGKTTALNALAAAAAERGERVGLVSIGLDGEAFDAWSGRAKPAIHVERGTLVITAERMADAAGGVLRVLGPAGFASALGTTVIAEARTPGGVELCGVPHRAHLIQAVAQLQARGATRVLVDGAYHRQAAAHPDVADAVVASVGAIVSDSVQECARLALPTLAALATPGRDDDREGVLVVPGALTDAWLTGQRLAGTRVLQVADASRVLLSGQAHERLIRQGMAIQAVRPLPLLAVTTNPHRPGETDADPADLQAAIVQVLQRLGICVPVIDAVAGTTQEAP